MSAVAVAPAVAEVDAAGELADDQQVGALDALAAQRARVEQRLAGPDGPQVREQPEALAEAEQALLGPGLVGIGGVPLRAADGAEQHGVGRRHASSTSSVSGGAVLVDRGAADQVLVDLEVAEVGEHADGRGADLRADPVAGQQHDPC